MKNIITTIFLVFALFQIAFSQANKGFNYQTVLRDHTRQLLVNQSVSFRMSLLEDDANGFEAYTETHESLVTDEFGRVSLIVGQGDVISGEFDSLDWESVSYYLQVEIDPKGGNDFIKMGAAPLLAVPLADHALTATWETSDHDRDTLNEVQLITKNGNSINLSLGGGEVVLNDDDPLNEVQTLSKNGSTVSLSLNGGEFILNDDDPANELQQLSLVGDSLVISNGNAISLAQYQSVWMPFNEGIYYPSGKVVVGSFNPYTYSHNQFYIKGNNAALRLEGSDYLYGARLNFGDGDYAFIEEDSDDRFKFRSNRFWFDGGSVGIGTSSPTHKLHLKGGNDLLRLEGAFGTYGYGAKINFGDGNFVRIEEYEDDKIKVHANTICLDGKLLIKDLPYADWRNVQWNDVTGELGYDNSSRRYKENITPLVADFSKLLQMQPMKYTRPAAPGRWEIGFIAEDFHDAGLTELVEYNGDDEVDGLNYEKMVTFIVPLLKEQKAELDAANAKLTLQGQKLAELEAMLIGLSAQLSNATSQNSGN